MKTIRFLSLSFATLVILSCSHRTHPHSTGTMPPGQVKKVTGAQSAKPYAPGQQKKKK